MSLNFEILLFCSTGFCGVDQNVRKVSFSFPDRRGKLRGNHIRRAEKKKTLAEFDSSVEKFVCGDKNVRSLEQIENWRSPIHYVPKDFYYN